MRTLEHLSEVNAPRVLPLVAGFCKRLKTHRFDTLKEKKKFLYMYLYSYHLDVM